MKAARREFIDRPIENNGEREELLKIKNKNRKINDRIMFVNGPAREIFPFFSFVIKPRINTAPGAAKIKPKKLTTSITKSILLSARNSAQHP